jgi:hypothetical protein
MSPHEDDDPRITAHLYPGEQVLHCIRGVERPAWALALLAFARLLVKRCLIVATERRLLLIVQTTWLGRWGKESFASVPWGELERAELTRSSFWRTLRLSAHGGRWRREFRVRPTYAAHLGIVSLWQTRYANGHQSDASGLTRASDRPARSRTR